MNTPNCNINDLIEYSVEPSVLRVGKITEVSSDMDSYEDMKLKDGIPLYYSKKLKKYVPVKEKNMASVFLEVSRMGLANEYIGIDSVI